MPEFPDTPPGEKLRGFRVHRRAQKTAVVAYVDVIYIFVTAPENITAISDTIQCYERATGAILNVHKSKALAVGTWDNALSVLDIP